MRKISNRIYYMEPDETSDRPVLGYIRGDRLSFAVDSGASAAHVGKFYDELRNLDLPLPDLTGVSHWHWDHSYGISAAHGLTIASKMCNDELRAESKVEWSQETLNERYREGEENSFSYYSKIAEYQDLTKICVRPADIEIEHDISVNLGGVNVQILCCGGPHSDDSLMFYIPEERFLFVSDASGKELMELEWTFDPSQPQQLQKTIGTLPYNQKKLRPFIGLLEEIDFDKCILGHEHEVMSKSELVWELRSHL